MQIQFHSPSNKDGCLYNPIIQLQVIVPTMLKMTSLAFSKHCSKSINEGCRAIYFIIITLYTGFSIENDTENCIQRLHFLLFHHT